MEGVGVGNKLRLRRSRCSEEDLVYYEIGWQQHPEDLGGVDGRDGAFDWGGNDSFAWAGIVDYGGRGGDFGDGVYLGAPSFSQRERGCGEDSAQVGIGGVASAATVCCGGVAVKIWSETFVNFVAVPDRQDVNDILFGIEFV